MAEESNGRLKLSFGFVAWAISLIAIVVANWASTLVKISALDESMKVFSARIERQVEKLADKIDALEQDKTK